MVGPAFMAVAAWLAVASPHADIPKGDMSLVARERFAPGARRQHIGDPPSVVVGGFSHACNECHRLFNPPLIEHRTLMQHTDITFNHGANNHCFNCHDRSNRERLTLHDGTLIGFDQVPRLCAQCHGTVYRDWQHGMHGKTMGSWDAASGKQHRLDCNDCHDPHSPAYGSIAPLPGPNTLRMGDQSPPREESHRHMPLRRWSLLRHEPEEPSAAPVHRPEERP
jgi:hypothetical protein